MPLAWTEPVATRSVNGPAYARTGAAWGLAPTPSGALTRRSGETVRPGTARPCCDARTTRSPLSRTTMPKEAGAWPPTFAATRPRPSSRRARSTPPYGNARWLTAMIAVL